MQCSIMIKSYYYYGKDFDRLCINGVDIVSFRGCYKAQSLAQPRNGGMHMIRLWLELFHSLYEQIFWHICILFSIFGGGELAMAYVSASKITSILIFNQTQTVVLFHYDTLLTKLG